MSDDLGPLRNRSADWRIDLQRRGALARGGTSPRVSWIDQHIPPDRQPARGFRPMARGHAGIRRAIVATLGSALPLASWPAAASPALPLAPQVDALLTGLTDMTPGCVIAVSRDGQLLTQRAYGMAEGKAVPMSANFSRI